MERLESLETNAERRGKRGRFWIPLSLAWFIVLINPVASLFGNGLPTWRIAVALAALAAFIGIYFRLLMQNVLRGGQFRLPSRGQWLPIMLLLGLATGLTRGYGPQWMLIFVFVNSAAGVWLPSRHATKAIVGITLVSILTGIVADASLETLIGNGLTVLTIGFLMWSFTNVVLAYRELRAAREGLAKLAVAEERLRFARDLHDLLGHNLSVIALKSELAGKLATNAPERAVKEINEIEAVARRSLHDIREAVAGYRQPTLDMELRGAREVLAAAGIALHDEIDANLPDDAGSPFAWAVREGVTNVVRHSRARRCSIRLTEANGSISLEIRDDGASESGNGAGSGLAGLRERFAAIGGRVEAGGLATGGFRLLATAPAANARVEAVR
jgi:two-component system sensor histidine kinase DesK